MSGHRWQFMLRPRWLAWHLFAVVAFFGMLWLGDWQLRRAESGNELSWAYTIEWPLFAICGVYFYVRTIREELHGAGGAAGAGEASGAEDGAAGAVGVSGGSQEPENAEAYLARLRSEVGSHGRWHGWR
jgi:hypothetical protein